MRGDILPQSVTITPGVNQPHRTRLPELFESWLKRVAVPLSNRHVATHLGNDHM